MGQEDNSYVIGIFDCCREKYSEAKFPKLALRGDGDANEEKEVLVEKGQNVFLIFGCPANRGVPATSKIASQFFDILELARAENGSILLPDVGNVFIGWTPNE